MAAGSELVETEVVPRLPKLIDVNDLRSVVFWSRRFGVTRQQLRRAVKQVGPEVLDVARYLGQSATVTQ